MPLETASAERYRTKKGAQTRNEILAVAVEIASSEGLEGLTIGRLAAAVGMSKAGVFAHFGSKEELQLAAVDHAAKIFEERVVSPALAKREGIERLAEMMTLWGEYVDHDSFCGGCFFAAAAFEFDGRPGGVRDRVAELTKVWRDQLKAEAGAGVRLGEIDGACAPAQLAFELHAYMFEANWAKQLLGEADAFAHVRKAVSDRLRSVATPLGLERLLQAVERGGIDDGE